MFISPYFSFRGKDCRDYFVIITTTDSEKIVNVGVPYSVSLTNETYMCYTETEDTPEPIELNLTLLDENRIPIKWTREYFTDIRDWLITDNFEEFISYDDIDSIYYFKCIKLQKNFTFNHYGWVTATFQPLNHYAYKRVVINEHINQVGTIRINNITKDLYEPKIIINHLGDEKNVIKIGDLELTNVAKNENVTIDNKMTTIFGDIHGNMLSSSNRKWIVLKPNENIINIKGTMFLNIICEFPMIT